MKEQIAENIIAHQTKIAEGALVHQKILEAALTANAWMNGLQLLLLLLGLFLGWRAYEALKRCLQIHRQS